MAPPAGAQTKEEIDRARVEFHEGVVLMAANNCNAALTKFQSVAKVKRTPQVLFNIGACEERVGKLVSALGNYRLAAAAAEGDRKAKDVASRVGERITSLEERIPKLTIRRGSGAETATLLLDGAELGALARRVSGLWGSGWAWCCSRRAAAATQRRAMRARRARG